MTQAPAGLKKVGHYWNDNLKVNGQRAHGSTRTTIHYTPKITVCLGRRRSLIASMSHRDSPMWGHRHSGANPAQVTCLTSNSGIGYSMIRSYPK